MMGGYPNTFLFHTLKKRVAKKDKHAQSVTHEDREWIMNYVMKNKSELFPSEIVDASRMQREKQHGRRWRNYKFPPGKDKIFLELKNLSEDGVITWENEKGGRGLKSKIKIVGNIQRNDKHLAQSGILDALRGVDELEKITGSGKMF